MNRDNLRKLANYLEGDLKAGFDMGKFTERITSEEEDEAVNCGSVGCALGHGPWAGIEKLPTEKWSEYCERQFETPLSSDEGLWVFSGSWKGFDNTPRGAAKRIYWLLLHGVPKNFLEKRFGKVELCYAQGP